MQKAVDQLREGREMEDGAEFWAQKGGHARGREAVRMFKAYEDEAAYAITMADDLLCASEPALNIQAGPLYDVRLACKDVMDKLAKAKKNFPEFFRTN